MTRIHLSNAQAAYDGAPVIRDVSFEVRRGEFAGLAGPNGSGKSTILRLIGNLLQPQKGRVEIDGQPVGEYKRELLARRVAVVSQQAPLDFEFTVEEVVMLGRIPHLKRFQREGPDDRSIVEEALGRTELSRLAGRLVTEISAGERQRVAIARALAQQPEILILDEPTAHLDIRHQVSLLSLFGRLCRRHGLTVLAVLHDLNLAAQFCQRLILLKEGRVFAIGKPADILDASVLRQVYGVQASVSLHPVTQAPCIYPVGRSAQAEPARQPSLFEAVR